MHTPLLLRVSLSTLLLAPVAFADEDDAPPAAAAVAPVEFNRDIRPLLSDNCFHCHGPDKRHREAGLRVDIEAEAKADRGGYRAIVPGRPAQSELFRRITAPSAEERMPPADSGKELSAHEIELVRNWIAQGAEYQAHWSFVPPTRPDLPAVAARSWPRNPVDRFVLARLEAERLAPTPPADRTTLLRRVSFDLLGLPPSAADTASFLADERPDAYERLVDRLLGAPAYGERLAVYWLDLVRYADTVGYHGDQEHNVSPYREYVISAFNRNLRFDRFTAEQLAGDLIPGSSVEQKIASGYNRLLQTTHEGGAQDGEYLAKYAADRVRNLSTVWLGATVGCAECHDHKYDPYTQRDFYSLAAFFADIRQQGAYGSPDRSPTTRPPELAVLSDVDRARLREVESALAAIERELTALRAAGGGEVSAAAGARGADELEAEKERLEQERAATEKRRRLTLVTEAVSPRPVRVLARGDWMDESGDVVTPAVPGFLEPPIDAAGERATRLDLARWLTSGRQPQTARVFVNRLWYLFFGAGLSRGLDDTGSQGEWPTHPRLLDFLAVEFVESGWDVKHVVRLLVTSSAYRQGSVPLAEHLRRDPENRLLGRQGRFRLPGEFVRDQALATSGLLVHRLGGPSARPYQPSGYYAHLNFPQRRYRADRGAEQYRRGVYTHWQRQFLHPMLRAFDAPSREECVARRPRSNTPLAALALLNDPTFVEAARVFAARALREGGADDRARLEWMVRTVLTRAPAQREQAALLGLLAAERAAYAEDPAAARALLDVGQAAVPMAAEPPELAAWTAVARALFNLDEAITRD